MGEVRIPPIGLNTPVFALAAPQLQNSRSQIQFPSPHTEVHTYTCMLTVTPILCVNYLIHK
jgi:hypothetical protein